MRRDLLCPQVRFQFGTFKLFWRMHVCLSVHLCVTILSKENSDPSVLVIEIKTDKELLSMYVIFRFHKKPLPGARRYICKCRAHYIQNTSHVRLKSRQCLGVQEFSYSCCGSSTLPHLHNQFRHQVFVEWLLSTGIWRRAGTICCFPNIEKKAEVSSYTS